MGFTAFTTTLLLHNTDKQENLPNVESRCLSSWRMMLGHAKLFGVFCIVNILLWIQNNKFNLNKKFSWTKYNFGEHQFFLWGHWYPCFGLLVTWLLSWVSKPGWICLTCMLHHLHVMDSSDSPLRDTCLPLGGQHGGWAVLISLNQVMFWSS